MFKSIPLKLSIEYYNYSKERENPQDGKKPKFKGDRPNKPVRLN
jgi:hypothetical protein